MSIIGELLGTGVDLYKLWQEQENFNRQMEFNQQEANTSRQFSHDEAQLAYERELSADSSKYQRQVADMQAAGLNPMMAVSAGAGSVHSSPGSSAMASAPSAPNLGNILSTALQMKQLDIQKDLAEAEIRNKDADTANKNADTESKQVHTEFFRNTADIRAVLLGDDHERNQWEKEIGLRGVEVKERNQSMLEENAEHYNLLLDSQRSEIAEKIKNKPFERALMAANARESEANALYKSGMLALDQEYSRAATEQKRNEIELLAIEARIKNGIYNESYIKAVCKAMDAEADIKTIMSEYQKGDYHSASKSLQKVFREGERLGKNYGIVNLGNSISPSSVIPALN